MLLIFSKVLVVFIYIGVGFIANRLKVLPEESVKHFISLVMGITVPCLMISSITRQEINGDMYRNTILVLALGALIYIVTTVVTTFIADRIFTGEGSAGQERSGICHDRMQFRIHGASDSQRCVRGTGLLLPGHTDDS